MKKFIAFIQTDRIGSRVEVEFEVEDDATDEQIEEAARDAAFNFLEWDWNPVEETED